MSKRLTVRDVEILRTLLRLQVATTAQLQRAFFTQARLARRRLQVLRERGYITVHGRGARGPYAEHGGTWWRLTAEGVQMVACVYPSESMPDNAVGRAARASLRNFEHREAIGDLYLGLITDRHKDPAEIAARASGLIWHGEYDVALPYETVEAGDLVERQLIPDATIVLGGRRCFVELDRSTESRARCERAVLAYDRHVAQGRYAVQFPDGHAPQVLYVTRSRARAESLQRMLSQQTLQLEVTSLPLPSAVAWLRHEGNGHEVAAGAQHDGQHLDLLRELYELAREGVDWRVEIGALAPEEVPRTLRDAYEVLRREGLVAGGA